MAKRQSFVRQIWNDSVQEVREWLVDTPRDLVKQPFWRQLITWPLYIGLTVMVAFVGLLIVLYTISFVIGLF